MAWHNDMAEHTSTNSAYGNARARMAYMASKRVWFVFPHVMSASQSRKRGRSKSVDSFSDPEWESQIFVENRSPFTPVESDRVLREHPDISYRGEYSRFPGASSSATSISSTPSFYDEQQTVLKFHFGCKLPLEVSFPWTHKRYTVRDILNPLDWPFSCPAHLKLEWLKGDVSPPQELQLKHQYKRLNNWFDSPMTWKDCVAKCFYIDLLDLLFIETPFRCVPSTSGGNEPLHGYSQYVHSDGDSQPRTIGTIPDIVIHPSFLSTNVIFVAEVKCCDDIGHEEGLAQLEKSVFGLWRENQTKCVGMVCLAGKVFIHYYTLLERKINRGIRTKSIDLMYPKGGRLSPEKVVELGSVLHPLVQSCLH